MASDTKCRMACGGAGASGIWFIGWLFTIGFAKLTLWPAVLGIIVWPYYLGVAVR